VIVGFVIFGPPAGGGVSCEAYPASGARSAILPPGAGTTACRKTTSNSMDKGNRASTPVLAGYLAKEPVEAGPENIHTQSTR